jgi:hypothetical protein
VSGELPRTTSGTPSYTKAKYEAAARLHDACRQIGADFGLTNLEIADALHEVLGSYLKWSRLQQQKDNKDRKGAIGTPREQEKPRMAAGEAGRDLK